MGKADKITDPRYEGPCINCGVHFLSEKKYRGYYCPECRPR